jgi:precorrin-6B C5,15-methyltransferase / cobalt-precorrin-6B C5,C15-methyltransferase
MAPAVVVIGVGDGGVEQLPTSLRTRLAEADLIFGGERHLANMQVDCAEQVVIKAPLSSVVERIGEAVHGNRRVAVLASGDPCCFGIGPLLVKHFGRTHVEIIPNVSSVQLLFARLGEPWQDARILSAHGRPIEPVIGPALSSERTAILTDDTNTPAALARALVEAGMEDCRAVVGERLGGPAERIVERRLSEMVDQAFDPLSILALFRLDQVVRTPRLGLPDRLYQHRDGMLTKAEVRAVSVSQLALQRRDIVWDIGAGCGSVGLEAASFVDTGFIYAIESDDRQIEYLRQNLKSFPGPLRVIHGEAPGALTNLPDPDAVFIGGSGGQLEQIVRLTLDRLRPRGRLVANFVVLDHLMACQQQVAASGWQSWVMQVAVNRFSAFGRFQALNPVFVLTAVRERSIGT